eukprot:6619561-Pyramimonas_sp.AAC.1
MTTKLARPINGDNCLEPLTSAQVAEEREAAARAEAAANNASSFQATVAKLKEAEEQVLYYILALGYNINYSEFVRLLQTALSVCTCIVRARK